MQIVKLISVDYSPIKIQSGIKRLVYEPQQIMQLILGDNGSGKSSLLKILSFATPDKNDFDSEGYRELHAKDDNHYYKIINDFTGRSPHHEFWVDDHNLNDGYTQTVQNELISKHLNYSNFIHQILSGKLRFCDMPKRAREDLLIKISGLDLDYAFNVHDKLRNEVKETNGVIRHVKGKYQDITARLSSMEDPTKLIAHCDRLTQEINTYFTRTNYSLQQKDIVSEQHAIKDALQVNVSSTMNAYKYLVNVCKPYGIDLSDYDNIEGVADKINQTKYRIESYEAQKKKLHDEMAQYEDLIKRIDEMPENVSSAQLTEQIAQIDKTLSELPTTTLDFERLNPTTVKQHAVNASQALLAIKDDQDSDSTEWTEETVTAAMEAYRGQIEKVNRLRELAGRGRKKLEHIDLLLEGVVICPKCETHIYKDPNVSQVKRKEVANKLAEVEASLIKEEAVLSTCEATREQALRTKRNRDKVIDIIQSNPTVKEAFRGYGGGYGVLNNIHKIVTALHGYEMEADTAYKRKGLFERRDELKFFLTTLDSTDPTKVKSRFRELEENIHNVITELANARDEQHSLTKVVKAYRAFDDKLHDTLTFYKASFDDWERHFTYLEQSAVNNHVSKLQTELATVKKAIQDHETLKTQIDELEKEQDTIATRAMHLSALVDAINHRTGVIADQLAIVNTGFVNAVNKIIGNIWEKDVVLQYPETGKKSGNFYVAINGRVGPELSSLSSGQKDIFNLAVSLVVMAQLNLTDYPLYLDEVGATFDERHRDNLMFFIKDLVLSGAVSMIFMISHYAENHGGFSNVDVSVLDGSNISIQTDRINEFFHIER